MRRSKKHMMYIGFLAFGLAGCSEKGDTITPADLKDLEISTGPGTITLQWAVPKDSASINHIKVEYYDHLLKKNVLRAASVYSDNMVVDNTRQKYGEYTFKVSSVSPSGHSGSVRELSIVSEPALTTYLFGEATQIDLTESMLSAYPASSWEDWFFDGNGSVANLIDGKPTTYFCTNFWYPPPMPHWIQIDLGENFAKNEGIKVWTQNRNIAGEIPTNVDLLGSMDAEADDEDWFLIRNFTAASGLTVSSGGEWTSPNLLVTAPFRYIRFSVNAVNAPRPAHWSGSAESHIFSLSGLKIWRVETIERNPEAADADF